jgi:hypothetical protein
MRNGVEGIFWKVKWEEYPQEIARSRPPWEPEGVPGIYRAVR